MELKTTTVMMDNTKITMTIDVLTDALQSLKLDIARMHSDDILQCIGLLKSLLDIKAENDK